MAQNSLFSRAISIGEGFVLKSAHEAWKSADEVTIDRYWNGEPASRSKPDWNTLTRIRTLWSREKLYFRFDCSYDILSVKPELGSGGPIDELWETDVFEVFLRPSGSPDYFEFEVGPLGQWLDVHVITPRQNVDFAWSSHLVVTVDLDEHERTWSGVLQIPFEPMLHTVGIDQPPKPGELWGINLFRLAGEEPNREYLAWRPTRTIEPDFHVPSAFGHLVFLEEV